MILAAAGAGVIRQDVQQAIEREVRYRLGEGDAPGALARWHKELLLLVIQIVRANACLSQLHARAAVMALRCPCPHTPASKPPSRLTERCGCHHVGMLA
jgi:hypothetical protein